MSALSRWWIALVLILTLPAGLASAAPGQAAAERFQVEPAPRGWAGAAVVLDWETGEVLYQRNAYQRRAPASTTKVLTALIALERGNLDDLVTVSRRAARTGGSSMYIREGEVYSLYDLLHGLLLRSGNDAAVAIAEHIGGSVEGFAQLMNARARELGATRSHFVNPHGLTHREHLSTAYDLAVITRAALRNPLFARIVSQGSVPITFEQLGRDTILYNTNKLLGWLPGADGVKTGTTAAAGPCLIASATRDGQKVIAVVLHASNRWRESAELLEWAFRNFQVADLGQAGDVLQHVTVRDGKRPSVPVALTADLSAVLPRKGGQVPSIQVQLQQRVQAPVAKGQPLGVAIIETGGSRTEVVLAAAESVPRATWLDRLQQFLVSLLRITDFLDLSLLFGHTSRLSPS
ncbi:MAG: D-alanyl-D-alanine carboxypeptidase family protein [Bacillota bacterium]